MNRTILNCIGAAMLALTAVLFVDFFMASAFAQSIEVPEINPLQKLGELVLNWSTMGDLSKGVAFVAVLTQVLKQAVDFQYKRLAVIILSILYGVGQMVLGGEGLTSAIVAVLVSGGGAMALYEVLKPLLKKIRFLKIGS